MIYAPRLKLLLGKFRITYVDQTPFGAKFSILLPGLGNMICDVPVRDTDVREGDIVTLYTEILTKAKSDDNSG